MILILEFLSRQYNPTDWGCIGPKLVTKALRNFTGINKVEGLLFYLDYIGLCNFIKVDSIIADIPETTGISVADWRIFISAHIYKVVQILFPEQPKPFSHWQQLFQNSSTVHFASSQTSKLAVQPDPQYSAYALLGPHYCPVSYSSELNF